MTDPLAVFIAGLPRHTSLLTILEAVERGLWDAGRLTDHDVLKALIDSLFFET